jgi:hypothetical protein
LYSPILLRNSDDRDGKLVGRLEKKQKDDESDDEKPLLGKPMKEGACSKFEPRRSKRMSFEDSGPARKCWPILENFRRGHSCRLRQTNGKRGHPEHEGEQARRISPRPGKRPIVVDSDSESDGGKTVATAKRSRHSKGNPDVEEADELNRAARGRLKEKSRSAAGPGNKQASPLGDDEESWKTGECWH